MVKYFVYAFIVDLARIELATPSCEDGGIPLTYRPKNFVPLSRIELLSSAPEADALSVKRQGHFLFIISIFLIFNNICYLKINALLYLYMIYLYFNQRRVQILSLKKTILGQQEVSFFEKEYETDLLENNEIKNIDFLASAIKEGLNLAIPQAITEKDVCLILPQSFFSFFRTEVPSDIAPLALESFVRDKAKSLSSVSLTEVAFNYLQKEKQNQKIIIFYSIKEGVLQKISETFKLLDLKIESIIPETLVYFKLFEKTLRKEKKEIIFYVSYQQEELFGYLYDSYGLINDNRWSEKILANKKIEAILKEGILMIEKEQGIKINRIVLAGEESENIRQDTFTKAVGVWTNPLKRIITNFYKDYLEKLVLTEEKMSILKFSESFGGYIFYEENGSFLKIKSYLLKKLPNSSRFILPSLFKREFFVFIFSFIVSFLFFLAISNLTDKANKSQLFVLKKITPTVLPSPTLTPTPTPSFTRQDLKIKILNGSGVKGKAAEVKDILKEKGYGEIITDNADSFDYKKTEIKVKKDKNQALPWLNDDLKNYISFPKIEELAEDEIADVIIIIGADFK